MLQEQEREVRVYRGGQKEFSSEISEKMKNCSDNDTKALSRHQELQRRSFSINEIFGPDVKGNN